MLNVQCRLCSSETTLISLFSGKSRGNRDHIRKLIYITTGIKFQKNDACKCICLPCIAQIYNFYVFRARSIENEKKLQASPLENIKVKSNKLEIPDVDDITLPNIEEIKETLAPWLISKQECCAAENNEGINKTDENTSDTHNENITNNGGPEMVENSTQCDSVQNFDKETQIQLCINEVYTQTSNIATRCVQIQCDLTKRNQKILKKVNKECSTQTEADNTNRSVHIQCDLTRRFKKTSKSDGREMATQTESNSVYHSHRENKFVKLDQKILKNNTDTNQAVQCSSCSGLLIQNGERELLKSNHKTSEKESIDSSTQTESKCDTQDQLLRSPSNFKRCRAMSTKDSVKLSLVGVKQEVESPQSLSPMKSLSINADGTKTEILVSPTNSSTSPRSSGLFHTQNKIQNVFVCQQCDKTTYSKGEYKLHKKRHLICNFCKKRFTSIRKTKHHIASECEVQKLIKPEPVVTLVRLEDSKYIQRMYPSNLKWLSENKVKEEKDIKKLFRLRSRSMSNTDSVYNNATSCKCCISILSGISVGVDKSVQTNFFFEKQFMKTPLEYFCENLFLKRNLKGDVDNSCVPTKKLKLS